MNRRERGFTLIEMMIALVVSSLLVGMILAIFNRMSLAYRGQQQVAGVQQVLAAARAAIEQDAKQAGYAIADGFQVAKDQPAIHSPLVVVDSAIGPDQVAFFYADTSAQALVVSSTVGVTWLTTPVINVASTSGFSPGDLIVMANPSLATAGINLGDPNIATYTSCVAQIHSPGGVTPTALTIETAVPWGHPLNNQCVQPSWGTTMIYKFVAHAYRIDQSTPARAALGPLQMSSTGGLLNNAVQDNWIDIAYGFTDLQAAIQMYEPAGTDNGDVDTDPQRNWYSGAAQTTKTDWVNFPPAQNLTGYLQMTISLVARTDRDVEGVATGQTPALIDTTNPNFNTIGNRNLVSLPSLTDPALQGQRIYRYVTFGVDFRNMGVGR